MIVACCVLIAAAIAHGWHIDRWGVSADLNAAAARLHDLPMRIGDWEGEVVEMPPAQIVATHVAGLTARRYTHRYTRAEVTVLILCGRPGPVSVHTPDICYQGAGFSMGPIRMEAIGEDNNAWAADFTKRGDPPVTLRIRWAWGTGGPWVASNSPRVDFFRAPVLYKMYIVRPVPHGGDNKDHPPELEFAHDFLPALQTILNPPQ